MDHESTTALEHTLYGRLGGASAIRAAVDAFYTSVLQDAELAPFFAGVDLGWLQRSQEAFLTQALGGPAEYRGRDMRSAHARMGLKQRHFDLVAGHLVTTLAALNVHEELIAEVVSVVAPLSEVIVSPENTDTEEVHPMSPVTKEPVAIQHDAAALHSMLENMPVNVMLADLDLNLTYVNRTSIDTLRSLQHLLPIPVDQMVGTNIDIFHKDPAMQRKLLANPANLPHRAVIGLADEKLSLLATAVLDEQGRYVGPMVTWEVVTAKLQQEKDLADAQERERLAAAELSQKVDLMLRAVTAAADGDLTQEVAVTGQDAIGQMGDGLNRLLDSLRSSVKGIVSTATNLNSASEELTATAQQMAATSEETSAQAEVVSGTARTVSESVQTVASGTEELSASIKEIARNASGAADVANEAVRVTQETNNTISKLGESSLEIGQVIKVITSIAQQTNLLALNATIEAARAGDAGKGFAVVANEVKELAKETAKATEDIGRKIEAIQADTHESVQAIERISAIIGQINEAQGTIASAVEEQAATTNEMARSVSEANAGTREIAENIQGVAQAAQDTSRGSAGVEGSAGDLLKMASELQQLVGRFKV